MTIQASCGHILCDDDGPDGMGWPVIARSWSREWEPAVTYRTVCTSCRDHMVELGVVLDETAEKEWLSGKGSESLPTW